MALCKENLLSRWKMMQSGGRLRFFDAIRYRVGFGLDGFAYGIA
jgi:hypothetical protein